MYNNVCNVKLEKWRQCVQDRVSAYQRLYENEDFDCLKWYALSK